MRGRIAVVGATLGFIVVAAVAAGSSCGGKRDGYDGDAAAPKETASPTGTASFPPPVFPPPAPVPDATVPVVACGDGDAGGDAGDAGPCDTPPSPRCVDGDHIASYGAGPCSGGACAFTVSVGACACIRADGGDFCQQIGGK